MIFPVCNCPLIRFLCFLHRNPHELRVFGGFMLGLQIFATVRMHKSRYKKGHCPHMVMCEVM
jgi:hypothetical protein